jgi:hypothetical protein
MVWFGKDELWTAVPADGISEERRSLWWSADFTDPGIEPSPDITVTYTLLNSSTGQTIVNDGGTNASTPEDGLFIIAGSEPDIEGCWQVTAVYKNASLSYVYYNPEGQDPGALTAVVPEVVGMTVDNARRAISGKGFKPFFVDSDDELYEVCAQDPADGSVMTIGGAVEMRTAPLGGCAELMGVPVPNVCYREPEFIEGPAVYFNCSDGTDSETRPVQRSLATDLPFETAIEQVFAEMLQGPTPGRTRGQLLVFVLRGNCGCLAFGNVPGRHSGPHPGFHGGDPGQQRQHIDGQPVLPRRTAGQRFPVRRGAFH